MLTEHRLAATWILGLLLTATVTAGAVMVRHWLRGRLILDRRQVLIRLGGLADLALIWVMLGLLLLRVDPVEQAELAWALFYSVGLLAVSLLGLVVVDLRLLAENRYRQEAILAEEMIRLWQEQNQSRSGPP